MRQHAHRHRYPTHVSIPFKGNIWFMLSANQADKLAMWVSIPFKGNIWFMPGCFRKCVQYVYLCFNPLQGEYLIHASPSRNPNPPLLCFNPLQGEYLIHARRARIVMSLSVMVSIPFKGNIWFMQGAHKHCQPNDHKFQSPSRGIFDSCLAQCPSPMNPD